MSSVDIRQSELDEHRDTVNSSNIKVKKQDTFHNMQEQNLFQVTEDVEEQQRLETEVIVLEKEDSVVVFDKLSILDSQVFPNSDIIIKLV